MRLTKCSILQPPKPAQEGLQAAPGYEAITRSASVMAKPHRGRAGQAHDINVIHEGIDIRFLFDAAAGQNGLNFHTSLSSGF